MAKIYVASSWRNPYQPEVVDALRTDIENYIQGGSIDKPIGLKP